MSQPSLIIIKSETATLYEEPSNTSKKLDTLYPNERYDTDRKQLGDDDVIWYHLSGAMLDYSGWVKKSDITIIASEPKQDKPATPSTEIPAPSNPQSPSASQTTSSPDTPTHTIENPRHHVTMLTQNQQVIAILIWWFGCGTIGLHRLYVDGLGPSREIIVPVFSGDLLIALGTIIYILNIRKETELYFLALVFLIPGIILLFIASYQVFCDIYRIYTRTEDKDRPKELFFIILGAIILPILIIAIAVLS